MQIYSKYENFTTNIEFIINIFNIEKLKCLYLRSI